MNEDKVYEELAVTWRHFALWREKSFAGYLTVLAALGVAFSTSPSTLVRLTIFLAGMLVSIAFWILDLSFVAGGRRRDVRRGASECRAPDSRAKGSPHGRFENLAHGRLYGANSLGICQFKCPLKSRQATPVAVAQLAVRGCH